MVLQMLHRVGEIETIWHSFVPFPTLQGHYILHVDVKALHRNGMGSVLNLAIPD